MEREKILRILQILKTIRDEFPGIYRKYCILTKQQRVIIVNDLLSSETKEDIIAVITDIIKKYEENVRRNRKLLGLV
jgi:FPC/CPF motif-containing protein YcgG